ncbi:hypothetical protein DBB36_04000 [Flavobacterium sp. WLB]|uniref:hypothetical protein n=1 Tax=unclassified Flavobacterium TaxID=196869 RepID=UPI0006AB7BBB|nr:MULTISPECIES: hypothetical protein [unclassified Flavobacterium]KOP36504.1 hypothetical protein AKO67_18960 [Flavobacterium sp. VMW]OWU90546.1 hypothetical protein APR43_11220 [Flavobacterium sp. NLM]PUU71390.1 hypothetical protein DBB36_04000 [Flavobacterium sp. WLB]
MKRLKKVLMPFLVFGTIVLAAGCDNEENDTGQLISQNAKIDQAKNWFENYKSNSTTNKSEEGEFNKAFRNLDYYWENAKVIQLSDNSTGITVPIKDNPEDPDYKGQKMLYLYESDSKYQALIQEIFPESQDKIDDAQKKQGFEDLTFFSGYIIHWDFKKGFLKGAKFENDIITGEIKDVTMVFDIDANTKRNVTGKMAPMFDEGDGPGAERIVTTRGGSTAIPLNNVIVTQKSPAPTPSLAPRDFSIAGAFGDGGSSGNSGTPTGGGSGITAPTPEKIIDELTGKAKCIFEKLKNSSSGFENAIKKFDGEFTVSHMRLTINNALPANVYGQTLLPINFVIEVQINNNRLDNLSDLGSATVFAHEIIHAEIYRKMLSAAQLGTLMPDSSNMNPQQQVSYVNSLKDNFPGLYDYYYKRWKPTWNHEMMANHYRSTIASIIQQFDNSRLPRSTYESIAWLGLGRLDTNITTIAWDNQSSEQKAMTTKLINEYIYKGPSNCN